MVSGFPVKVRQMLNQKGVTPVLVVLLLFVMPWRNGVVLVDASSFVIPITLGKAIGAVVGVAWLISKARLGEVNILPFETFLFGCFVAWSVITILWTPSITRGLSRVSSFILSFGLSLIVFDVLNREKIERMAAWALFSGIQVVTLSIYHSFLLGERFQGKPRFTGAGYGPNAAAVLITVGAGLLIHLIKRSTIRRGYVNRFVVLSVVHLGFTGLAVVLTGSRQGLVLFSFPIAYFMFQLYSQFDTFGTRTNPLLLLGMIATILTTFATLPLLVPEQTIRRIASIPRAVINGELSGRLVIWTIGFNLWSSSPFIGIGVGGFAPVATDTIRMKVPTTSTSIPVDNSYLGVLYKMGVVGFILWFGLIIRFYSHLFRFSKNSFPMLAICTLGVLSISSFFKPWHNEPIFYILVFLLISMRCQNTD